MRPSRIFVALAFMVSALGICAVISAFSEGLSPGQQHELVMQMNLPTEVCPVFSFIAPDTAPVPYGAPPTISDGVLREVVAQCNSPGMTI